MSGSPRRALMIGLGSLHGGDDRVGLDVAAGVAAAAPADVEVVEHADPTDLLTLWEGHDQVVVADALLAGDDPGKVLVIEMGRDAPPDEGRPWTASGGTHAFGLTDAVALARTLGRVPRRLTVVGVVGRTFRPMDAVSPEVSAAIPGAVDEALRALACVPAEEGSDVPG